MRIVAIYLLVTAVLLAYLAWRSPEAPRYGPESRLLVRYIIPKDGSGWEVGEYDTRKIFGWLAALQAIAAAYLFVRERKTILGNKPESSAGKGGFLR